MAAYKKMDQKTLDREYSARGTVSDGVFEAAIANYTQLSEHCRQSLDCRVDIPYGSSPDEVLDIFPAGDNAPLFIFIHGGYWRALSQKESSFMAEAFTKRGVAVAAVNYSLAPEANLDEIVRQCRRALAWTYDNAKSFGVDRERIYIGGSSAGGHLGGMLISSGWHRGFGVRPDIVKGACALSGLFELEPLLRAEANTWMNLDEAAAKRNSPANHLPEEHGCPLIVSYGGNETAEFKRQTDDYAAAWRNAGFSCTYVAAAQRNHFDIVMELCDPIGELGQKVFSQIGV